VSFDPASLRLVLRMSRIGLLRDWRSGELTLLAASVVIAIASATGVGFFTDRLRLAMLTQANALLGGDLAIESSSPLPQAFTDLAADAGLAHAETLGFRSVVSSGEDVQLAELKAVSNHYPLRGRLEIADRPFAPATPVHTIPAPGTVWVEAALLHGLGLAVGDRVGVGALELTIAAVLVFEPDRGGQFFSIAPRLMMNLEDIPAAGLVLPGSRVTYHLLLAGEMRAVERFREAVEPLLALGMKLRDAREARPEVNAALTRAEQFLGLAALISVIVATIAIAACARRYAERHLDNCAIMRCAGAPQGMITLIFSLTLLWLGVLAALIGIPAGFIAQRLLEQIAAGLGAGALPPPSAWPALTGLACATAVLVGFAAPPIARLRQVPPARVLRRELTPPDARSVLPYAATVGLVVLLAPLRHSDAELLLYVVGGCAATVALLALGAAAAVHFLRGLRRQVGVAWQYGFANVARRPLETVIQASALGVGITVLLLLGLVRGDLLESWRRSLPPGAPNHFLINIQPDEVGGIGRFFARHGIPNPGFHPMVRARLTRVNDRPLDIDAYSDPRARRLAEREFNLSWTAELAPDNRVIAGRWWDGDIADPRQFSTEIGIAEDLGFSLGDRLTYRVADQTVIGRITSLRSVEWDSFNVNFFVVSPPGLLEPYPATYISSVYLGDEDQRLLTELVRQFPSVTVIDVDAVMTHVRRIMDQVSLAVEFVFSFTLLAGVMVLLAGIQATRDARIRESAVLRALGASTTTIVKGLAAEFLVLGVIAGSISAVAAAAIGYVLAEYVFEIDYSLNLLLAPAGLGAGVLGVGLAGLIGMRRVLATPPLAALRQY
jgi:putative ABC transport system permease protein